MLKKQQGFAVLAGATAIALLAGQPVAQAATPQNGTMMQLFRVVRPERRVALEPFIERCPKLARPRDYDRLDSTGVQRDVPKRCRLRCVRLV